MAERTLEGYYTGRPTPVSPYRVSSVPAPIAEQSEFGKAVDRGQIDLRASLYGAAQQVGDATGIDRLSEFGREGYEQAQRELADPALQASQPDVTEVDFSDPKQIYDWATGAIGSSVPYALTTFGGGAVGGMLAKILGRSGKIGAATGAVAASAPVESGSIYKELEEESGVQAPGTAAVSGLASGLLNLGTPATALSRNATGNVASRVLRKGAETGVVEAGTEALQEGVRLGARDFVDPTYDPLSEDSMAETQNRLINALAAGGVAGGTLGGASGLLPARRGQDDESFDSRYERYLGPADGSLAFSLAPEDAQSPLNLAVSPVIDAYRAGTIDRPTLEREISQIADQYEQDDIIYMDIARRIQDIDSGFDAPSMDPQATTELNDAEANRDGLTTSEGVGSTTEFTNAQGFPWNETDYDRAAADYNAMFRSSPSDTPVSPAVLEVLDALGIPESPRSQQALERLRRDNPDLDLRQVSTYDLSRAALQKEGVTEAEVDAKLDSLAINLAARNRDSLPAGVRPAEYLRRQMAIQSVGQLPSAVAPLASQISDAELRGELTPAQRRLRGRLKKYVDEQTAKPGRLNDQDQARLSEAEAQLSRLERQQRSGGLLVPKPKNPSSSILNVKQDGIERGLNLPRLTRRMMDRRTVQFPEDSSQLDRLRGFVAEGLSEIAAKGVELPSEIDSDTVVFNGRDGRTYTWGEVFPEANLRAGDFREVGQAKSRAVGATSALERHTSEGYRKFVKGRGLSPQQLQTSTSKEISDWRRRGEQLKRQQADAFDQLNRAENDFRRKSTLANLNYEVSDAARANREVFRDRAIENEFSFLEDEPNAGDSTTETGGFTDTGSTTPRRSAVEGDRSVPASEPDPAPIRQHTARQDPDYYRRAIDRLSREIRSAETRLRQLTQPGSQIPLAELNTAINTAKLEIARATAMRTRMQDQGAQWDDALAYYEGIDAQADASATAQAEAQRNNERKASIGVGPDNDPVAASLAGLRAADTTEVRFDLQQRIDAVVQATGITDKINILTVDEALELADSPEETMGIIQGRHQGFAQRKVNKDGSVTYNMYVDPRLSGRRREFVIAHEFGHMVAYTHFRNAPKSQQSAIVNDYERWLKKYKGKDVAALLRDKKPADLADTVYGAGRFQNVKLSDMDPARAEYLSDFDEWMADRVARELMAKTPAKTPLRKFFEALINQLRKLANALGIIENGVHDALRPIISSGADFELLFSSPGAQITPVDVGAMQAAMDEELGVWYATAMETLKNPFSDAARNGVNQIVEQYVSDEVRNNVMRGINVPAVKSVIERELGPVTPGNAYALWSAGVLNKIGPGVEGLFKRLAQGFADLHAGNAQNTEATVEHEAKANSVKSFSQVISYETQNLSNGRNRLRDFLNRTMKGVKSTFFIADERLRATGIPALEGLASMLHKKVGTEVPVNTMQTDKQIVRGRWDARARQIFEGKSAEFGDQVLHVLYRPDELANASPEIQEAANKVFGLMRQVRDYLVESGVELGDRGPNYFPWVVDLDKIDDQKLSYLSAMLVKPEYEAAIQKELDIVNAARAKRDLPPLTKGAFFTQVMRNFADNDGYVDTFTLEEGIDSNPADPDPVMRSMNRRVLGFIQEIGTPGDKEFIASLMEEDMGMVLSNYFGQAAKRGEYNKRFGDGKLDEILNLAREQGATDEDIDLANNYIKATMGVYGRDTAIWLHENLGLPAPEAGRPIAQSVLRPMGAVMVYQNMRTLALATFTSLADFMGIGVRTGNIGDAFVALKEGFTSVVLNKGNDDLSVIAETLGIIDYNVVNEALGWEYGGAYLTGTARQLNEGFFKWIGLQSWTRTTRVMGTSAAMRFLGRHQSLPNQHSERFLRELGLAPEDIILDDRGMARILTYAERKTASPEELARDDRVRNAVANFVDEAILRPNPSQRPLWASDPHYMLVFHLKSFMYSFHDRILKRVYNEAAKHKNFGPALSFMGYVPVMIAADLMRDMVANGGEEDPRKSDWGMMDYVRDGVFRAGLPGVPGLIGYDLYRDFQYDGIPGTSLLGPTAEQIIDPPELNDWVPGQQLIPDVEF